MALLNVDMRKLIEELEKLPTINASKDPMVLMESEFTWRHLMFLLEDLEDSQEETSKSTLKPLYDFICQRYKTITQDISQYCPSPANRACVQVAKYLRQFYLQSKLLNAVVQSTQSAITKSLSFEYKSSLINYMSSKIKDRDELIHLLTQQPPKDWEAFLGCVDYYELVRIILAIEIDAIKTFAKNLYPYAQDEFDEYVKKTVHAKVDEVLDKIDSHVLLTRHEPSIRAILFCLATIYKWHRAIGPEHNSWFALGASYFYDSQNSKSDKMRAVKFFKQFLISDYPLWELENFLIAVSVYDKCWVSLTSKTGYHHQLANIVEISLNQSLLTLANSHSELEALINSGSENASSFSNNF